MTKPRYRYDWKGGYWVSTAPDGGLKIVMADRPVTPWFRKCSMDPRPMPVVLGFAYGGGGGGCMYSH